MIAPQLVRTVVEQARTAVRARPVAGIDQLTDRETEVLRHLAAFAAGLA